MGQAKTPLPPADGFGFYIGSDPAGRAARTRVVSPARFRYSATTSRPLAFRGLRRTIHAGDVVYGSHITGDEQVIGWGRGHKGLLVPGELSETDNW